MQYSIDRRSPPENSTENVKWIENWEKFSLEVIVSGEEQIKQKIRLQWTTRIRNWDVFGGVLTLILGRSISKIYV